MRNILFAISLSVISLSVHSQSSDFNKYLNLALEKLEQGDCEAAQKLYDVYTECTKDFKSSIEVLISDCINKKKESYSVGDTININGIKYTIAYLNKDGRSGIAIHSVGRARLSKVDIEEERIPTKDELYLIFTNRDILHFYDKYWSCTYYDYDKYYVIDFTTTCTYSYKKNRRDCIKLQVYRF